MEGRKGGKDRVLARTTPSFLALTYTIFCERVYNVHTHTHTHKHTHITSSVTVVMSHMGYKLAMRPLGRRRSVAAEVYAINRSFEAGRCKIHNSEERDTHA